MPIRVGTAPKDASSSGKFWGLKAGEAKDLVLLTDVSQIVSAEQVALWDFNPAVIWTCTDVGDPSRDINVKPAYRAYIPVLVDVDGAKVVKIWSCTRTVHSQICDIAEAMGESLIGLVVKAKRTGEGLQTKYSVVSTGRRYKNLPTEIPSADDVIQLLEPKDRNGIIEHIEQTTGLDYDTFVSRMRADNSNSKSEVGASRKPGTVTTEDF